MPYNGSGVFSRVHDWTDDRDAGIKIQAARMDAECDDYAQAFNQVFLRSGIVAMTGDLNLGNFDIERLADGSAGAPSIRFNTDTDTGMYLASTARLAFSTGGVERMHVDNDGVSVTGDLEVSGSISGTITVNNSNWSGADLAVEHGGTGASTASAARSNLGLGSLATQNNINNSNWSGTDLSVANGGTGRSSFTTNALIKGGASALEISNVVEDGNRNLSIGGGGIPANFWGTGDNATFFQAYGNIGSQGGFTYDITANGYRNDSGQWTSLGVNSSTSAAQISLSTQSGDITFHTDAAKTTGSSSNINERMRVAAGGNVGIGTTSPIVKLHVNSGTSDVAALFESGDNGGFIEIRDDGSSPGGVLIGADDDNFVVRTSGSERFKVSDAGVVSANGQELGYRGLNFISTSGGTATSSVAGRAYVTTGNITVSGSTFVSGDIFTIVNNSSSNISIVQGSGMNMRLGGTTTTGTRTLAPRGIATVVMVGSDQCIVTGHVS